MHGAVLRQLGTPAAWPAGKTPLDLLAPVLRAAAATARQIALGEAPAPEDQETRAATKPRPKNPPRRGAEPSARTRAAKRAVAVDPAEALVHRIRETLASISGADRERSIPRRSRERAR